MILGRAPNRQHHGVEPVAHPLAASKSLLLIDVPEAMTMLSGRSPDQAVVLTQKRMLTPAMITSVNPDAIIAPLITKGWDIVDLGLQLEALGYRGDLYAYSVPLPRAELVIREVNAMCAQLSVHLLEAA